MAATATLRSPAPIECFDCAYYPPLKKNSSKQGQVKMGISLGELDWSDRHSSKRLIRGDFIEVVSRDAPEVFGDLSDEPLTLFRELEQQGLAWSELVIGSGNSIKAFLKALRSWSRRWNLNAEWVRQGAYETFLSDPLTPPTNFWPYFRYPTREGLYQSLQPPYEFKEYWPLFEFPFDYMMTQEQVMLETKFLNDPCLMLGDKRLRAKYIKSMVQTLAAYCHDVERTLLQRGFVRPNPNERRNISKHLDWAVSYQVCGMGWTEIGDYAQVGANAVQPAVVSLLKLIDLPIRKSPQGRPAGAKSSAHTNLMRRLAKL